MVDQTPALKAVIDELEKRHGTIPGSRTAQYIRPIIDGGKRRPELGYSQHSYRNASDLKIYGWPKQKPYVDTLTRMRNEGFPVGTVLHANNDSDHRDHIHVEGDPKVTGDPKKPETWNISTESGDSWWDRVTEAHKPGNSAIEEAATNPGGVTWKWFGEEISFGQDIVLRIVFGIITLVALIITVMVTINAFKSDIAGAALDAVVKKGKK